MLLWVNDKGTQMSSPGLAFASGGTKRRDPLNQKIDKRLKFKHEIVLSIRSILRQVDWNTAWSADVDEMGSGSFVVVVACDPCTISPLQPVDKENAYHRHRRIRLSGRSGTVVQSI